MATTTVKRTVTAALAALTLAILALPVVLLLVAAAPSPVSTGNVSTVGVVFELIGDAADAQALTDAGQHVFSVDTDESGEFADLPAALEAHGAYITNASCECLTLPVPTDGYVVIPLDNGIVTVYPTGDVEYERGV